LRNGVSLKYCIEKAMLSSPLPAELALARLKQKTFALFKICGIALSALML
jgi:hypothetical protein